MTELRLRVLHSVNHAVSNPVDEIEVDQLFQPVNQGVRGRRMSGERKVDTAPPVPGRIGEGQSRARRTQTVNLSVKPQAFRRVTSVILRELDTR